MLNSSSNNLEIKCSQNEWEMAKLGRTKEWKIVVGVESFLFSHSVLSQISLFLWIITFHLYKHTFRLFESVGIHDVKMLSARKKLNETLLMPMLLYPFEINFWAHNIHLNKALFSFLCVYVAHIYGSKPPLASLFYPLYIIIWLTLLLHPWAWFSFFFLFWLSVEIEKSMRR